METRDSGDDAPADKYLRADVFVAQAWMDELTGSWLVDDNGEIDDDAATATWTVDCLGGGGALDKQAEIESTEEALDSLLGHGMVEDMKRDVAVDFKFLTTRAGRKDGRWKMKVRFVAREYKWAEHREDLFSLGATRSDGRAIDFIALKLVFEGEQGRFGDERVTSVQAERFASCVWGRGPWRTRV